MAIWPSQLLLTLSTSSSLFMSLLFAYSASVQLNDPDWYFWFPLYALASLVNLLSVMSFASEHTERIAAVALFGGSLLLTKVLAEARLYGLAGFWSTDMGERVVREKMGSALVVMSMALHLVKASATSKEAAAKVSRGSSGKKVLVWGLI